MVKYKVTQKEKNIFWSGLLAGMVGSLLGNFLVSYLMNINNGNYTFSNFLGVILFTLIFFAVIVFINKQIVPVKK